MSRILRSLLCLLLICCMLVNLSPLKSNATGIGAATGIASAAGVSVPALWPIVAALAVVGVTAYGIDSGAFEQVANSCYSALEAAGTWIQDGKCTILRTTDENGNTQFYVDGGMIADIKDWLFSDAATSSGAVLIDNFHSNGVNLYGNQIIRFNGYYYSGSNLAGIFQFGYYLDGTDYVYSVHSYIVNCVPNEKLLWGYSSGSISVPSNYSFTIGDNVYYYSYSTSGSRVAPGGLDKLRSDLSASGYTEVPYSQLGSCLSSLVQNPSQYSSSYDLTLGYLPSEDLDLDESTIVSFHPYLAQVIQTKTGGSGGSGDGDDKWWLAAAYADTLEQLYQTSQQAQIENPSVVEIPDLQEGTQYEVTVEEDEDGNKKYILNPIYDPGSNPGTGTDPGTDPDPDPDPNPDSGNGSGNNTGTDSGNPGSGGVGSVPSGAPAHFALGDLSKFFPFCIPFDLFDFFKLLNADPVAPEFSWTIQDLSGQSYSLTIDLSEWDSVAQLFRRLQLFLFVCGLAAASRKFIKW